MHPAVHNLLGFASSDPTVAYTPTGLIAQVGTDWTALFAEELPATQLATDLACVFFPSDAVGWAEDITIGGDTVRGIVETASTAGSEYDGPRVLIQEDDWTDGGYSHRGATLLVVMRTEEYRVLGAQPDGLGLMELVLVKT